MSTEYDAPGVFGLGPAFSFMRRMRAALDAGLELPEALAAGAAAMPREARDALERAGRRLEGRYHEDEWGFDEEFAETILPFFEFLYDRWWRVQTTGVENVPAHGRALLAANHAGIMPWDATMMSVGLLRHHRSYRNSKKGRIVSANSSSKPHSSSW